MRSASGRFFGTTVCLSFTDIGGGIWRQEENTSIASELSGIGEISNLV